MDFSKENTSITIGRIIARSISGTITPEEQTLMDDWLLDDVNQQIYTDICNEQFKGDTLSAFDRFDVDVGYQRFQASVGKRKGSWLRPWVAAAAAVVTFLAASAIIYTTTRMEDQPMKLTLGNRHDVPPGGNRATLTLADGRTIKLDEARDGIVIGAHEITYNDGVSLGVKSGEEDVRREISTLELTTPKGGTYQITLSDGTVVWLNASSTMKYPSLFSGNERLVELIGEAYFLVAKDADRPFKVRSARQEIEVLGTEFNVSAYPGNRESKTTLVEGLVQIRNNQSNAKNKLLPGQQSAIEGASTDVKEVPVEQYIAWKSGMFHFKHTPFVEMMEQVERWYDIKIIYRNGIPTDTFSGRMRRDVSLLTVLDLLKVSRIKFQLDGNKLFIE